MADVFISYKREERARVGRIASALEGLGLSVFFDARLPSGSTFDEEINRELRAAGAVLVCWTQGAIDSRWVRAEASLALEEDKLAPLLLERVNLPAPFNLVHSEYLGAWRGDLSDPAWLKVLDRIGLLCGKRDVARRSRAQGLAAKGADAESDLSAPPAERADGFAPIADFIALALIAPIYLLARGRWAAMLTWICILALTSLPFLWWTHNKGSSYWMSPEQIAFYAVCPVVIANCLFAFASSTILQTRRTWSACAAVDAVATALLGPFHLAFRRSSVGVGLWLFYFIVLWAWFAALSLDYNIEPPLALLVALVFANLTLAPLTPWLTAPPLPATPNLRQNAAQFLGLNSSKLAEMALNTALMAVAAPIYLLATRRIAAFGAWASMIVAQMSLQVVSAREHFYFDDWISWLVPCVINANLAAAAAAPWIIGSRDVPERRNISQTIFGAFETIALGPLPYLRRKQPGAVLAWGAFSLTGSYAWQLSFVLTQSGFQLFPPFGLQRFGLQGLSVSWVMHVVQTWTSAGDHILAPLSLISAANFGFAFFSPWLMRFGPTRRIRA
jgi:TIR domain